MAKPLVAIVGRPNVGKSALLNRLIKRREAIVEDTPGVTRDRLYRETDWNGVNFTLIDTGGILLNDPDNLRKRIRNQVEVAIDEADLILFVVDVTEGLHPLDADVADLLRKSGKKTMIAVNKVDNQKLENHITDFYGLGMGDPMPVSAIHGYGTGDMLDVIVENLPEISDEEDDDENVIKISLVGRPNVGKSSILNGILGEERSIVTDVAGTTRDAVDSDFEQNGQKFRIIDTAGLRRKGKIHEGIEYYSGHRARKAIRQSNVGILIIDAGDPAVAQDRRVGGLLEEWGKGVIIIVNKWDLLTNEEMGGDSSQKRESFINMIQSKLDFLAFAPVIFTSAVTGKGLHKILPLVKQVYAQCIKKVETSVVNRIFHDAFLFRPPPSYKGNNLKLFYASQKSTNPPEFILKVNDPQLVHFSYKRYLENQLRRVLKFEGTPIRLLFRK